MYKKTTAVAVLAMLAGLVVHADTLFDTTPRDDQANLSAQCGQTFKTGALVDNELTYITVDARAAGANGTDLYIAVYENSGNVSNWVPTTLLGVSTNMASLDVNGGSALWHFDRPTLSDNTDYLFMFTDDASGVSPVGVGVGMKGGSTADDGTAISGGGIPGFGTAFDIACLISTDEPPPLPGVQPQITSFTASETAVNEGDSVTLSWATENADGILLEPGVGDVTSITTTVVVVNAEITYSLIATNDNASVTNSLTINVLTPPGEGEILTSFGVLIPGVDDADQAGPIMGQSITINDGANTNDAAIPQTVALNRVTFQARSGNTPGTGLAYLHVYDDWLVDDTGAIVTVGNLVAVSTNTVDLAAPALSLMTWGFDLDDIDKATEYHYILATNATAATMEDSSNITAAQNGFELHATDTYAGGRAWVPNAFNVNAAGWDLEFEVVTTDVSTADPVADLIITGPISSGTQMVLSWTGEVGKPYGVETNSNLVTADWQNFETGLVGDGGTLSVTNDIGPDQTFYRVISE